MAHKMRHLSEPVHPRMLAKGNQAGHGGFAYLIERGDLLALHDAGFGVRPASHTAWDTNLATTQAAFVRRFAGVAAMKSEITESALVRVDTKGIHVFDCGAATFEVGDAVGPAQGTGNVLANQQVEVVDPTHLERAVGLVSQREPAAVHEVEVEIFAQLTDLCWKKALGHTTTTSTTTSTTTTTTTTTP